MFDIHKKLSNQIILNRFPKSAANKKIGLRQTIRIENVNKNRQFPVDAFQICTKCLDESRASGVTQKEGLCAREVAVLIHRFMMKTEKDEGVAHCLCRVCLGKLKLISSLNIYFKKCLGALKVL